MFQMVSGEGPPNTLCFLCHSQVQRLWRFFQVAHNSEKNLAKLLQFGVKVITYNCVVIWCNDLRIYLYYYLSNNYYMVILSV